MTWVQVVPHLGNVEIQMSSSLTEKSRIFPDIWTNIDNFECWNGLVDKIQQISALFWNIANVQVKLTIKTSKRDGE